MHFSTILFFTSVALALAVLLRRTAFRTRWMLLMPLVVLACMLSQLVLKGFLWQLVPVYMLSLAMVLFQAPQLFATLTAGAPALASGADKKWMRLSGMLIGMLLLILSATLLFVFPLFSLPAPTGRYAVGVTELYLNDTSRSEIFTKDPADTRELMVKVWYPSIEKGGKPEKYIQREVAASFAIIKGFPAFVSSHLTKIKTQRYAGVPLANEKEKYPVLLFSHGLQAPVEFYTAFLEELTSHGYIIFAIQHTYETAGVRFPDGRLAYDNMQALSAGNRWDEVWQINQDFMATKSQAVRVQKVYEMNKVIPTGDRVRAWAEDIHFLLDELERIQRQPDSPFYRRLNLTQLGGLGHSMGGAAMGQAMLQDMRIKAGVNWDGGQWGDLIGSRMERPFLAIDAVRDPAVYPFMLMNPIIYSEADLPRLSYVQIEGGGHSNFSDMAYLTPLKVLSEAGSIDPDRAVQLVNGLTLSFFNTHLQQRGGFEEELKQPEIRQARRE